MTAYTLSILVSDRPGVLARISSLFSRRGFNIESLAVGKTEREGVSRMTVVAEVDDPATLEQIVKQLYKLIEVRKVIELGDASVAREMILVKVKANGTTRGQVIDIVNLFRSNAVDVSNDSITIEATGSREKLDALLNMLEPHGIQELVQSGQVALCRGNRSSTNKSNQR